MLLESKYAFLCRCSDIIIIYGDRANCFSYPELVLNSFYSHSQPRYQEKPFAHVDFYPNGGYDQLCKGKKCTRRRSHIHGIYYFNESITAKGKPLENRFMSWRCGSSEDWEIFKKVSISLRL